MGYILLTFFYIGIENKISPKDKQRDMIHHHHHQVYHLNKPSRPMESTRTEDNKIFNQRNKKEK